VSAAGSVALAVGAGALAGATLAGIAVWRYQDAQCSAQISTEHAASAQALAAQVQTARVHERDLADQIAAIDAAHTEERSKADAEIARLRGSVDSGAVRLHVRTACPAAGMPAPAAGPGLDPGARAELAADARPDYFALRSGLTRVEGKLAACQQVARAVAGGER